MWKWLFILLIAALGGCWWWDGRTLDPGPGRVAPAAPEQSPVAAGTKQRIGFKGFVIRPLAEFKVKARVLSRQRYTGSDPDVALAPVDLALGWGAMSDSKVLERLSISQDMRFYFWQTRGEDFPVPMREIETSSANMHLIASTPEIERAIRRVHRGQVVSFSGWLVAVSMPGGGEWRSSLSREDSGAGACELVFVREFAVQ